MDRNRRLAYSTESPYETPKWPVLSSIDEADIVDLLCRLLEPIGDYRREHVRPSKGKSSRKRKREVKRTLTQESTDAAAATPAHPIPDIFSHITLGFNTTIRHLESLSAISRPQSLGEASLGHLQDAAAKSVERLAPLSAVFVCYTGLPPILTSCLPLLTATASLAFPDLPFIRLVPLGKAAEGKLAQALNQPKVGFVGLQSDISSAGVLLDTVRSRVEPVDVPWLKEASSGEYLPVKVKQTEVKIGPKKEKATRSIHNNSGPK